MIRPFVLVQPRCRRNRLPSNETQDVEFDRAIAATAPIVLLSRSFTDRSIAIVTLPKSERRRVYRHRLALILGSGGEIRRGLVEVVRINEALIRYL